MAGRWVDLQTAAAILGTSTEAVRKRAARGTLESEKREDGRVYVRVDDDRTVGGQGEAGAEVETPQLVEQMQQRIDDLREQLREEREARRRADTIIAQLTQANATLVSRVPQLEAPVREPEATQQAQEPQPEPGRVEGWGDPEKRSIWRRWFGG